MIDRSELRACADCLCLASRRASRAITRFYDRSLRPHRIRVTQFTILAMLELRGPTPIGALAEALGMERTTLTRNLALLARKRWVDVRGSSEDARSRVASIAAKGRAIVTAAFPTWRKAQAAVADAIGEAGVNALRQLARSEIR